LRPKGDALEGFFYLEEGKVTVFHTHGPLCIATPNARAYPIGTAFSVSFKTGKTTVLVLEGKVALEGKELPEERVIIEKGETGVLAGAKPPEKSGGAAMPYPESSEENTPWNNETQPGEIQYQ
jgi:ferric-dicitrate binding protein FerR (iron transport regulator)